MTPRRAGPAVLALREVHGHRPSAESHELFHMCLLSAVRVHLVTGPARPPLADLVHVNEMKILLPVPEASGRLRDPLGKCRLVVARKAQRILAV